MKITSLSNNAIDLVLTSDRISKSKKFTLDGFKDFDLSPVLMAESVINSAFDSMMLNGVKKCLEFQIGEITYKKKSIVGFSENKKLFETLYWQQFSSDQRIAIQVLADSLILTTVLYRIQLNEKSTGLAQAIANRINNGFIHACLWGADFSKDLNSENNEYIQTVDFKHAVSFIEGYPNG